MRSQVNNILSTYFYYVTEKRVDGVNVGKEAEITTHKSLMLLEAQLNKLLQRKSEIIKQNRDKKSEINHYRILRYK